MKDANLNWRMLLPAAAAVAASAGLLVYWLLRRPDDPDDIERQRRAYLNKIGRICEGQVIEIVERSGSLESRPSPAPSRRPHVTRPDALGRKLVCYSYSISGVTYETAQDVTGLEQRLGLAALATGQSASVKYDPSNPSNSILVADDWSGLS